jgi:hypothetical protein
LFTAGTLCLSLTVGVFAETPVAQARTNEWIAKLEARARQLEQAAEGTKGAHAALLGMQRVRVHQLIERIKAGENVDPQEIDALLRKDVHSVR